MGIDRAAALRTFEKSPVAHRIGRNRIHIRSALAKPESLPAEEEEGLVLHDGTADDSRRTDSA